MTEESPGHVTCGASTLVEVLRHRAVHQPDRLACRFLLDGEDEQVLTTYAGLDRRARTIATALQRLSVDGDRALLALPPGLEYIAAFFGCLYAGVVAVPVYPPRRNRSQSRLETIVRHSGASVILAADAHLSDEWFRTSPGPRSVRILATDSFDDALAEDWEEPEANGETLAFLQYTSGSLASPKGVALDHGNLLDNLASIQARLRLTAETPGVSWLPPYHDMGLIGGILEPIYAGFEVTLLSPFAFMQRPVRWLRAISRFRAVVSGAPNFAYDLCATEVDEEQRALLDLESWGVAFNGAEPVRKETLDRFVETFRPNGFRPESFCPCYGLAETTLLASATPAGVRPSTCAVDVTALREARVVEADGTEETTRHVVSSGQCLPEQRIVIVDPTTMTRCERDRVGEIWLQSRSVARGYWNQPDESELAFGAHLSGTGEGPFLRTGDLGFLRDGKLYVTGRMKDLIILSGRNYYPQDIEASVAESHEALAADRGAVFVVETSRQSRLIAVHEVKRQHRKLDVKEVVAAVRRSIAQEHDLNLHAVVLLKPGALPRTSSGKVQRSAARQAFLDDGLKELARWAADEQRGHPKPRPEPRNGKDATGSPSAARLEDWLGSHISRHLGVAYEEIDRSLPFAHFGMGSQQATKLAHDLSEWLGEDVSPTLAYDFPTIAELAGHLAGASGAAPSSAGVSAPRDESREPLAVVGIGCRFPGASGPDGLWALLRDGVDTIETVPSARRDLEALCNPDPPGNTNTRWGGFVEDLDRFDAEFFRLSPREAVCMDPQQRLVLEVACEALDDSGLVIERGRRTNAGVFIGVSSNDYGQSRLGDLDLTGAYMISGNALSIVANRVSYELGLHGPSLAVDTACSSSLVAVHLACQSLWNCECEVALAGGVNVILSPTTSVSLSKSGFLAPDGRCKAFDAGANGYVRGEGAGVVVLKPLSRALADRDRVYCVIRASAVNQDGPTNGLTAPSQQSQEAVLREAYRRAGVSPGRVQYVEAHGTGTMLGDPIEAKALTAVLSAGRAPREDCAIGSIKTNIGHLEAAAGVAGLLKVALSLKNGLIPASLHFNEPNPHIPFDEMPLHVQGATGPWPEGRSLLAGVSAFGFGGTNAHVVLEEAPKELREEEGRNGSSSAQESTYVLPLSARTSEALHATARAYVEFLRDGGETSLRDICYTAGERRRHDPHRLALVGSSRDELQQGLQRFLEGESPQLRAASAPVFVFPEGAPARSGVRQLFEGEPAFREALERCERLLGPAGDWIDSIPSDSGEGADRPVVLAIQYALWRLWRSWGVVPGAVLGHGVGELAAAHAAGLLTLEDALCVALQDDEDQRSRLFSESASGPASYPFLSTGDDLVARGAERIGEPRRFLCANSEPFAAAVDRLAREGLDVFVEVTLEPLMSSSIVEQLARRGQRGTVLPQPRPGTDWGRVLRQAFGELYASGCDVDWKGVNPPGGRCVHLPSYPWQRERYWIEVPDTARPSDATPPAACRAVQDEVDGWLYEPTWQVKTRLDSRASRPDPDYLPDTDELARSLRTELARLNAKRQMQRYRDLRSELDRFCSACVVEAFGTLGWRPESSATLHVESLAEDLGIAARHRRLLSRLLAMLQEDGVLERTGDGWVVRRTPRPRDPTEMLASLRSRYPDCEVELSLVGRCAGSLADVLTGAQDPLELIFPGGHLATAEHLYQDSPFAATYNGLVRRAVASVVESLPADRSLRFLELGAGTGGTTSHVLPVLPADRSEYVFTDVSSLFLARAEKKFEDVRFVRHHLLDVESSPDGQGFAPHRFDVILAANALHATRELRATLRHVKRLLAPGGLLLLQESTGPERWMDLVFGLTEGWWRFTDNDLRPHYPMLPAQEWKRLLEEEGFHRPHAVPETGEDLSEQVVILARGPRESSAPESVAGVLPEREARGRWLIFANDHRIGEELEQRLTERGQDMVLVSTGTDFVRIGDRRFELRPGHGEDVRRLLREAGTPGDPLPVTGVVHLWSLSAPVSEDLTATSLEESHALGAGTVLHLVQEWARAAPSEPPRLWLVTRGAQPLGSTAPAVAQTPLWGFGRTLAREHPSLWGGLVDLDPEASAADAAGSLAEEILDPTAEEFVVFRRGDRHVARLAPKAVPVAPVISGPEGPWHRDASYLITGGQGDLGLRIARWMVEQGARRLILLGRTPLPPRAEWRKLEGGTTLSRRVQAIREIEALGASVHPVSVDVTEEERLSSFLDSFHEEGWPPIRGVVHAAGIASLQTLEELDPAELLSTLRPKVHGAWLLHRAFEEADLDFFVLFSSVTSLLSSPRVAHYAAANAFLDGLAHYRRARGLPAISVNWGLWGETGMAARHLEKGLSLLQGVDTFPLEQGLDVLGRLIAADAAQVAVLRVDWQECARSYPVLLQSPFLSDLARARTRVRVQEEHQAPSTLTRHTLLDAEPEERERMLIEGLREYVGSALDLPPQHVDMRAELPSMGFDSMMAMDMKSFVESDLGVFVPVESLLKDASVSGLASQILEQLAKDADAGDDYVLSGVGRRPGRVNGAMSVGELEQALENLDRFSDDEVESLLRSMLGRDQASP